MDGGSRWKASQRGVKGRNTAQQTLLKQLSKYFNSDHIEHLWDFSLFPKYSEVLILTTC